MAEIPVEKKSSKAWLWILLALILIGALIWWATDDDGEEVAAEDAVIAEQADAGAVDATAGPQDMTIAAILANPSAYYGMEGFTGEMTVAGPITDRGFYIENEGNRMFAIVIDQPQEQPVDLNPGATIMLNGGTVRDPSAISDLAGVPLDQDTVTAMEGQDAVLVVNQANIQIAEGA